MAQTTFYSTNTNIDIELLKRELEICGAPGPYTVIKITPGPQGIETNTVVIVSGTIVDPSSEYTQIQDIIDNHINSKDPLTTVITSNLDIRQDLQVDGDQTIFHSETVTIDDHLIQVNSNATVPEAVYSGVEIYRGTGNDSALIVYDERPGSPGFKLGIGESGLSLVVTQSNLGSQSVTRNQIAAGTGQNVLFNDTATGRISEDANLKYNAATKQLAFAADESSIKFTGTLNGVGQITGSIQSQNGVHIAGLYFRDETGNKETLLSDSSRVTLDTPIFRLVDTFVFPNVTYLTVNNSEIRFQHNNFHVANAANNLILDIDGAANTIGVTASIIPTVNTYSVGSSGVRFANVYADTINTNYVQSGFQFKSSCAITANTVDGSDTFSAVLAGGGGGGATGVNRGSYIGVYGNEASGGKLDLFSGNSTGGVNLYSNGTGGILVCTVGAAEIDFATTNLTRWRILSNGHLSSDGGSIMLPNNIPYRAYAVGGIVTVDVLKVDTTNVTILGSASGISFQPGGVEKWGMLTSGHLVPAGASAQNLGDNTHHLATAYVNSILGSTNVSIATDSTTGSTQVLTNPTWSYDGNNGAALWLGCSGNGSNPGWAVLKSGSAGKLHIVHHGTTEDLEIEATAARSVVFKTAGAIRWYIDGAGDLQTYPDNTNWIGRAGQRVDTVRARVFTSGFTGGHFYIASDNYTPQEGDTVKLINRKLQKCTDLEDPKCIGIVSGYSESTSETQASVEDSFETRYNRETNPVVEKTIYYVIALGDSCRNGIKAKICNLGGDIVDGDLLCSSSKAGFLQKQSDSIIRSYTVAQARESISFDENGEAIGCYIYLLK